MKDNFRASHFKREKSSGRVNDILSIQTVRQWADNFFKCAQFENEHQYILPVIEIYNPFARSSVTAHGTFTFDEKVQFF